MTRDTTTRAADAVTEAAHAMRDAWAQLPADTETEIEAWEICVQAIPTSALKALVESRSVADAADLYRQHQEDHMSKKPDAQRRAAVKDAKADRAHWKGRADRAKTPTERATFQRGVDRAQARIDRNSKGR